MELFSVEGGLYQIAVDGVNERMFDEEIRHVVRMADFDFMLRAKNQGEDVRTLLLPAIAEIEVYSPELHKKQFFLERFELMPSKKLEDKELLQLLSQSLAPFEIAVIPSLFESPEYSKHLHSMLDDEREVELFKAFCNASKNTPTSISNRNTVYSKILKCNGF